jgi:hypothetical protein
MCEESMSGVRRRSNEDPQRAPAQSDIYLDAIQAQGGSIRHLYSLWEEKRPIILYDVTEQRMYAYPYEASGRISPWRASCR